MLYFDETNYKNCGICDVCIENKKHALNNSDFEELKSCKRWKKIKDKAEKYYNDYIQKVDFSLRKELNLMKKEDQRVRTNGFDVEGAKIVDSVNNEKLKRIVADCDCYPNYSLNLVGNYDVDEFDPDISVLIMHISSEDSEYWQPIFLDLIRRGRAPADIYGSLIDSNLRSVGIYQYGIYNNIKKDKIGDFENLDNRRITVGLPPWQLQKDIFELIRKKYGF